MCAIVLVVETLFGTEPDSARPWWRRYSPRFWLLVVSPFLLLAVCTSFSLKARHATATAERAVADFRQRLAAGSYDEIYDNAALAFKWQTSRQAMIRYLKTIHDQMGACRTSPEPRRIFTFASTSGMKVQLEYRSNCSDGFLDEGFTYVANRDDVLLERYRARAPFLPR